MGVRWKWDGDRKGDGNEVGMGQGEGKMKHGVPGEHPPPSRSFPAQFQVLEEPSGKGWNSSSSWTPQIRETGAAPPAPASLCPSQLSPIAGNCLEFQERRDKGGDNAAFPSFWGEKRGLGQGVGILLLPGLSPVVPACHRDPSPGRDWEWLPGERPEREMEAWDVPEGPRAGGRGGEGREGRIFQLEIGKTWRGWERGTSPLGCWSRPVPVPKDVPVPGNVPVVIPGSQMCPGLPALCP